MEYRETHYCPNCQRGWTHTFVDHCPLNTEAWCDDCMTLAGAYGPPASVELVLYNLDHCD